MVKPQASRTELATLDSEGFFAAVVAATAQPVCVIDSSALVLYANPAAATALGYDEGWELVGMPLRPLACPTAHTRRTGETVRVDDDWLVRRDGASLRVSHFSAALPLGGGRCAVFSFQDASGPGAARRAIKAADSARHQVTQDLHDGVQQYLATVLVNLQRAQRKWSSEPHAARQLVDTAADHAQLGVDDLRDLVAGLHPLILTNRGLGSAIAAFGARLPLAVSFVDLPERRFPAEIESSLYFLVTEALTNVVKHAKASSASVRFEQRSASIVLEVSDDGVGGAQASSSGRGLGGLADRVAALGGVMTLTSDAGQGTLIQTEVPLAGAGI